MCENGKISSRIYFPHLGYKVFGQHDRCRQWKAALTWFESIPYLCWLTRLLQAPKFRFYLNLPNFCQAAKTLTYNQISIKWFENEHEMFLSQLGERQQQSNKQSIQICFWNIGLLAPGSELIIATLFSCS